MEAILYRIPHKSRKDVFKIYPIGDSHCGTVYCAEKDLKAQIKTIEKDPHAYWVGMGDYADLILPHDPRWESHIVASWVSPSNIPESQCQGVTNLFKPIAHKCIGLLDGNHEISVRKYFSYDFTVNLAERLNVNYLGYSAFVRLIFTRTNRGRVFDSHEFKCFFTHGSGAPQTDGGKINNLIRASHYFNADIYAKGHLHDIQVAEKQVLRVTETDPPKIKQINRCAALTGCWFHTYKQGVKSSWAETRGYEPTRTGCPVFVIHPDKDKVNVYSSSDMLMEE